MLFFATLAGLLIATIIFINFIQVKNPGENRSSAKHHQGDEPGRLDPAKVFRDKSQHSRPRLCPVCGTLLRKDDYLIAALEPESDPTKKRKAQIYGCPYCYGNDGVNRSHSVNGAETEKLDI